MRRMNTNVLSKLIAYGIIIVSGIIDMIAINLITLIVFDYSLPIIAEIIIFSLIELVLFFTISFCFALNEQESST